MEPTEPFDINQSIILSKSTLKNDYLADCEE
jgi:hypothetical protein